MLAIGWAVCYRNCNSAEPNNDTCHKLCRDRRCWTWTYKTASKPWKVSILLGLFIVVLNAVYYIFKLPLIDYVTWQF